jgi:O-antigen/teichoic acid export membrane protein
MVDGTIRIFLAEALILPTGLLTAAFLTRRLGPEGYGMLTLTATLVSWVEWSITSIFARAAVKFVGEARDWRPVGATVLRLHTLISGGAVILLWGLAAPLASLFDAPALVPYLRLFACDIFLFSLVQAHYHILIGIGGFRQRAYASAVRCLVRLVLIIVLVESGLSVSGALLGNIGASCVELAVCRIYIRPSWFSRSTFPARQLWFYAVPLFLSALSLSLYNKLDLLMLKALGGTAAQAGVYGAAQNLSLLPGLFALAFTPLLLATLSRLLHTGEITQAKEIGRNAMRMVVGLMPIAALIAGTAPEIVNLTFGAHFAPAAALLAVQIWGGLALLMGSVATAIFTAAGKPTWTVELIGPLVPLAMLGHLLVIPRLGAIGAALVTTVLASGCALVAMGMIYRLWHILPPQGTWWRSLFVSGLVYVFAVFWSTPGVLLLVKLPVLSFASIGAFLILGEFSPEEIKQARTLGHWQIAS